LTATKNGDKAPVTNAELKTKSHQVIAAEGTHMDGDDNIWYTNGHEWVGIRVAKRWEDGDVGCGEIVRWLPAGEDPEDIALWHCIYDDGDSEDLDEQEVKDFLNLFKTEGWAKGVTPTKKLRSCSTCHVKKSIAENYEGELKTCVSCRARRKKYIDAVKAATDRKIKPSDDTVVLTRPCSTCHVKKSVDENYEGDQKTCFACKAQSKKYRELKASELKASELKASGGSSTSKKRESPEKPDPENPEVPEEPAQKKVKSEPELREEVVPSIGSSYIGSRVRLKRASQASKRFIEGTVIRQIDNDFEVERDDDVIERVDEAGLMEAVMWYSRPAQIDPTWKESLTAELVERMKDVGSDVMPLNSEYPRRPWGPAEYGVTLADGWKIQEVPRIEGSMTGFIDKYYWDVSGKRFRSLNEVRHEIRRIRNEVHVEDPEDVAEEVEERILKKPKVSPLSDNASLC